MNCRYCNGSERSYQNMIEHHVYHHPNVRFDPLEYIEVGA